MAYTAMKKTPLSKKSEASILVAWGGIEPPTQGFLVPMRTLGVIGPTRMPYERMIRIVDITAKLVSNALSHQPGH